MIAYMLALFSAFVRWLRLFRVRALKHPETETQRFQRLLNIIQRFRANVLMAQHLGSTIFNEISESFVAAVNYGVFHISFETQNFHRSIKRIIKTGEIVETLLATCVRRYHRCKFNETGGDDPVVHVGQLISRQPSYKLYENLMEQNTPSGEPVRRGTVCHMSESASARPRRQGTGVLERATEVAA